MTEPEQPTSLTARTVRGAAWTLATSLGSRVVGLVGTLLLARYLAPAEYGEVMAAAILVVTAFTVTTLGVGIYLVSNRDLTRADAFHATCWFVSTGVAALAVVWALAVPLGRWFDATNVAGYMPLFVLSAVIDRIAYVPERHLIRTLRFRWLSLARATGELVFTGFSLALAAAGHGASAIVYGYLARAVVRAAMIVPAVAWRDWLEPHPLHRATLARIIRFGVTVSIAGIATFLMRRWDNLLVSRFFGHATMGAYNYAYNLADTPAVAVGEQMSDVVAASFPHAEGAARTAALLRACTLVSLIMFPLAFGLGAVGDTVVTALFDANWQGVGAMLVMLSVLSAPRPLAHIIHAYLFVDHGVRVVLRLEWLSLAMLLGGIATIGRQGILWTCGVVGAVFALRTLALMWTVGRLYGIPLRSFLVPLVRPLIACAVMVGAIELAGPALVELSPVARLAIEIGLGAVVYALGARFIFREQAADVVRLVRSSLGRR